MKDLPCGSRARLMCENHPSGPLDVPDPAAYSDAKVNWAKGLSVISKSVQLYIYFYLLGL